MVKKTVSFRTFGCKLNQYDTDFLKKVFRDKGYEVKEKGPTDLVVVNTCVVTSRSAAKCRQAIRNAARAGSKVLVTGCYPQVAKEEIMDIPGVIAVTGVRNRANLVSLAEKALRTGKKVVDIRPHDKAELFEETPVEYPSLTRAFLKIQEGCDDFCTYCIVPYARGPSRSRPLERILAEARRFVARGYKEIVLTGTHLGLYGNDLSSCKREFEVRAFSSKDICEARLGLSDVVREICKIDGLTRLRLSSLEPHDLTDDLIDCLRLPQVCHHLHLPLQSGSDAILKKMGRRYSAKTFLSMVDKVRKVAPDVGISTDIIVGFPGETDDDFRRTIQVAREAAFSRIHVFKFSARPGTFAYRFPERVPERQKTERSRELISLGKELSLDFHRKHIGRPLEILVEDDRTHDGFLQGVSRNYIRCWLSGPDELKGKLVRVLGRSATDEGLMCEKL